MRPKIIVLQQAPVVLVELEERPAKVQDSFANGFIYTDEKGYIESFYLDDICEDSKLVGILSDLTEEQFAEWAVKYPGNATPQRYVNHTHKEKSTGIQVARVSFPSTYRASDSCLSLLESENVYMENPHGQRPNCGCYTEYDMEGCAEECYKWINAQSRTIDPKRTVILIRTKS